MAWPVTADWKGNSIRTKEKKYMYCKNCGAQLKNGDDFCANCGTKVTMGQTGSNIAKKPRQSAWQVPVMIATVIVVLIAGCFAVVLIRRGHDDGADTAVQDIISDIEDPGTDFVSHDIPFSEEITDWEVNTLPDERQAADAQTDTGQEPQAVEELAEEESQYILQGSSSLYLTRADLEGMTKEECRLARNELYARHGRKFDDEGLQKYFDSKDWYTGYIDPVDFNDSVLNDFEMANRDLIVQYEEEMGYR